MLITDDVYFYRGHGSEKIARGGGSCNIAIIKTDKQVIMDSGLMVAGSFKDFQNAADAGGLDLTRTTAVLHTHGHWDHIAGNEVFQKKYGARVYAHPWEKPYIESEKEAFEGFSNAIGDFYGEVFGAPRIVMKVFLWYVFGSYKGLKVDETLNGGEELDFGLRVDACHTPGHTPGHMGYYIPERKVFVGGDLIDLEQGDGMDLNNPYSNYADGLASLMRVRELDIEHFLPAHGDAVSGKENVQSVLDRYIENTHKYITDVTGLLSEREGTLTEIFNRLMPNTLRSQESMKKMLVLTVLKHLQEKGEASLRSEDGKHIWSLAP
jgi:glyoxylase-like metal-dependent hydrolase (beta-lactamase superfamily II)